MICSLELTKKLISFKSVTPNDAGSLDYLKTILDEMGFKTNVLTFSEEGAPSVKNLYAKIGNGKKTICFAGHVDVVPEGDLEAWKYNPFTPTVEGNMLYGRGSVDMKSGLACFIAAIDAYIKSSFKPEKDCIVVLITAGEEGAYINGTYKLIRHVAKEEKININATIVAEPSSKDAVGDSIKVGRRGSMNFNIVAKGKQGHVAYHKMANNPMPVFIDCLKEFYNLKLDNGNEYFEPSNFEITAVSSSSNSYNVIPEKLVAKANIRFNNNHTSSSLTKVVEDIVKKYKGVTIEHNLPHTECFLLENNSNFLQQVSNSVTKVTGLKPLLSTSGGTSDAAYIKDFSEVLELGLLNQTLHEVNERVKVEDIETLTKIYYQFLNDYFGL